MTETANKILPGQPCWIELYTAEPETSAEFYRELFGWNIEKGDPDSPLANVMSLSENMIGTIEPVSEEAPYLGWLVCLTMPDMSDFADKVEAAGGDVIIAPVRVDEAMVYAVVEDPDGSRVGVLHDPTFTGSSSVPVAGMPVWYDVMSRNFERCGAFYGDVFGWDRHPIDGDDFNELREALEKLQLNDAALTFEPETSGALGFGFRVGFLGLLHMEIVRERLEREFGLDLISTAPNVVYRVVMEDGTEHTVTNPSEYPEGKISDVYEPVVRGTILTPAEYIGAVLELCQMRRGVQQGLDYLSEDRVEIRYTLPLAEIVFDFFDALKSRTKGYASLDYEPDGEQVSDLVKVDILLHGDPVDAFSAIVHKDKAYSYGLKMAGKLKELIPRQQFEVPIQAAIGSRVIARETIRAMRKDVLAKCYGGDISRKRKLLEKQKEGKKRMKMVGRVEVPQEAFVAALSTSETTKK